jgi:hypothetical protein
MSIVVRLRFVCLLGAALMCSGAAQAQGWISFTPPGGDYAIDMPGTPKEVRQTAAVAGQAAELHQYAVEIGASEGFITAFSDLRAGPARPPAELMIEIQNNVLAGFKGGKLRGEKVLQFGRHPGRSFSLQTAEGAIYSQQIVMAGNRIYQNIAVTTAGRAGVARVQHVFVSFRVLSP